MKSWLKRLWSWLAEARPFWLCLLTIVITFLFIALMGRSEVSFRLSGMFLQLLGVFSVFWGIKQTRELFGRPTLAFMLSQWLKRFPPYKERAITASGIAMSSGSLSGRAYMLANVDPSSSIESRVEALEKNIGYLHKRIDQTEGKIESDSLKQNHSLEEEARVREKKDQEIHAQLEATETGGLHISAMGAAWILLGVVLSSFPNELSKLFG